MENGRAMLLATQSRGFSYGGREVLRSVCDLPHGACRAAAHFKELLALWQAFVEETLFQRAAAEWEQLAREGRAFAFIPHRAVGKITQKPHKRGVEITLSATLTVGDELRFSRTLVTLWDKAGNLQRRVARSGFSP